MIVCEEIKLAYKPKVKASDRPKVTSSSEIYDLLMKFVFDEDSIEHRETLKVVLFNRSMRVLGFHTVSVGGVCETTADVKIIMQAALLANASAIALAHNHPSGSLKRSLQDDMLTDKVKQCCISIDIKFIDHLIVTAEGYYSYCDEGGL